MTGKTPKVQKKKQTVNAFFTIPNDRGMHTRPAAEFVKCASKFKCHISLNYQRRSVNGKSLLGILTLAASKGTKLQIQAEGEDAEEAVKAILDLVERRFNIQY